MTQLEMFRTFCAEITYRCLRPITIEQLADPVIVDQEVIERLAHEDQVHPIIEGVKNKQSHRGWPATPAARKKEAARRMAVHQAKVTKPNGHIGHKHPHRAAA